MKNENLIPHEFKPGQSGNPNGRPKGPSLTTKMRALLKKRIVFTQADLKKHGRMEIGDAIVLRTVAAAVKGDKDARKLVFEYIEGKPMQPHDIPALQEHNNLLREIIKKAAKNG